MLPILKHDMSCRFFVDLFFIALRQFTSSSSLLSVFIVNDCWFCQNYNLPAMQETQVQSLGQKDTPGEGNGHPLLCSCLENPMESVAWWAIVHKAIKSWT